MPTFNIGGQLTSRLCCECSLLIFYMARQLFRCFHHLCWWTLLYYVLLTFLS